MASAYNICNEWINEWILVEIVVRNPLVHAESLSFFFSLVTASFPASVLISQIYKEGEHIPPPLNIEGPKEKAFSPNLTHNGTRYILAN